MSFINELKRRNVFRVAAAYIVTAWLVIQVVETIFPAFGFSDAAIRYVTIAFAAGLIPVSILAWVFELTPEGLKKDTDARGSRTYSVQAAKRLDQIILIVLALALGFFAFDRFVLVPEQMVAQVQQAREEGRSEARVEAYGDKSIAVLPFADMSPDGDQEYLSDGIAEELLNLLSAVPELRVISRTSAFAFKGQSLEVPEIAKRLKVGHVLEGSVRKDGNTIRITAQLIEARSDTHLWSQTWERELDNVFAIQDEISVHVVAALKLRLLGEAPSADTTDPKAYELVLKGRHLLAERDPGAERFFEQAIAVAPDYASAHAGLAKWLALQSGREGPEGERIRQRAETAIQRALELEPQDSDALAAWGLLLSLSPSGKDRARELWQQAIASNPNNSDAYRWLGFSYQNLDSVRYLEYMRKAYLVDPTSVRVGISLFMALARFGQYEKALAVARDLHYLYPERSGSYALAGYYYSSKGQMDLALKSYFLAYRTEPGTVDREIEYVGWLLIELGELELARAWALARRDNDPGSPSARFQEIVITYLLGLREEATRLVDEMDREHPEWWVAIGRLHAMVSGDFQRAREAWERGLEGLGSRQVSEWDAYTIVDYALALQHTGEPEHALDLIDAILRRMEQQMTVGVQSEYEWDLRFYAAILHAMKGETQEALAYLQADAEDGGLSCLPCLLDWRHFASLRDIAEFEALIVDQKKEKNDWRQRLAGEGLLLTPAQVLDLDSLPFDPFAAAVED